jgi:hypothetical protein
MGFWTFNLGNIITLVALLLAVWQAHVSNVKRIEDAASRLSAVEIKLDLIYGWFENNVIGRHEAERKHGAE